MQIGNSIYVDIRFKDKDNDAFLSFSDLQDLQIIETAGASLPYVYVKLGSLEKELIQYINKTNTVQICLGESETDYDIFDVDLFLVTPPNRDSANAGSFVEFTGFISNSKNAEEHGYKSEYMECMQTKSYRGTALRTVNKVIKSFFGKGIETDFTINDLDEKVSTWRQCSETPCRFVCDTLLHMNAMPDFPLFSFDKHGQFYVKSLSKLLKKGPTIYFTPSPATKTNEIQYLGQFVLESFKETHNLYSGANKVSEVCDSTTGVPKYVITENKPILANTQETTDPELGNRELLNTSQSANTHDKYAVSYAYNTSKLVALSSISGKFVLSGYYRDLAPLTLVYVSTGADKTAKASNDEGTYLIEAIKTRVKFDSGTIQTTVHVTRDEVNNLENYIVKKRKGLKIDHKYKEQLLNALSRLRSAYALGLRLIDGRIMKQLLSFAVATKEGLLRSFSAFGNRIDFNSSANFLVSLLGMGNSLLNSLVSLIFPAKIASVLKDLLQRSNSNTRTIIWTYVNSYVSTEDRAIIDDILGALADTNSILNSIARDNGVSKSTSGGVTVTEVSKTSEKEEQVALILKTFENNVSGARVPLPKVTLTEEEALLPEENLRDLLADKAVENLENLGYLKGVDSEEFKDILLGNEDLSYSMISKINQNAGNVYNYRYWGAFTSVLALTSFNIKKSFKEKFRTLPCTKLISATKNSKIFFACPSYEKDVKFYINSTRVELSSFEVDLGVSDVYGTKIPYTVYYTEDGYNSNSVLFEVKQGGLV